jgi:transposase
MEGNYRKATDEYIKILLETIDKEPQEMGYEFCRWTAKRLATYLTEQTGIELSSSQVTNILKKRSMFIFGLNIVEKIDKILKKEKNLTKN